MIWQDPKPKVKRRKRPVSEYRDEKQALHTTRDGLGHVGRALRRGK